MKAEKVESLSFKKKKPAEEEGKGPITKPRYLWGLSKRVERVVSSTEKGIGLAEPETMQREQHLAGLSLRSIDEVRLASLLISL